MKLFIATLLFSLLSGSALAQNESLSIEGLALRNARLLVAGMAFGFGTFDDELTATGHARLYCPPDDVSINGNYLWEIAEEELNGDHDLATVATTVLQRLRALYPCSS